jgi:tetratricopeptide (TPR) repeat protein
MIARWLLIALAGCVAAPTPVADTSMEVQLASNANREGEQHLAASNYTHAVVKFREAVARAPQAPYFVNLCLALKLEGQLHDAMIACDAAFQYGPSLAIGDYAIKLMREIEQEATTRRIELPQGIHSGARLATRPNQAPPPVDEDRDPRGAGNAPDPQAPGAHVGNHGASPPLDASFAPIGSRPRTPDSSQEVTAARVNFEGTEMMKSKRYTQASAKFREAVARVPEPTYFFNLCLSLYYEGKFSEAMTSCSAVMRNSPSASLETKAQQLTERVATAARRQGIQVAP